MKIPVKYIITFVLFLHNSYLGISVGKGFYGFGDDELKEPHTAQGVSSDLASGSVFSGHYFNKHLAFNLGYIRPFEWIKYNKLDNKDVSGSVRITLFTFTLRPTLNISRKLSVNGQVGPGYLTRNGLERDGETFIEDGGFLTFVTGGGLSYRLTKSFYADADVIYSFPRDSEKQPGLFYASVGVHYLVQRKSNDEKRDKPKDEKYKFPFRLIEIGGFSRDLFYNEPHKYFHPPNIPIFWIGDVKLEKGTYVMYEHNVYHTRRWFSFDLGASAGFWESHLKKESFSTCSVYGAIKIWLLRGNMFDLYVTYSAAGPTYISRHVIDDIDTGRHFTFQDFMGIGVFLGRDRRFNINSKIMHFSNGNIFPENTGVAVPSTIAVGYSF
jgi:hypothetical protein